MIVCSVQDENIHDPALYTNLMSINNLHNSTIQTKEIIFILRK